MSQLTLKTLFCSLFILSACSQNIAAESNDKNKKFRVIQIGDSHTAGDYFTDELRRQLQNRLGNGGIGLVPPVQISGQRVATMQYDNSGWTAITSRREQGDFPFGGMMAQSLGGMVTLSPRQPNSKEQNVTFTVKQINARSPLAVISDGKSQTIQGKKGQWQSQTVKTKLPFFYQAKQNDIWQVGSIHIENSTGSGAVVSSLGINGSQLTQWEKWRANWQQDLKISQADVVILAYGTNEAFNPTLDIGEMEQKWKTTIRKIRQTLPRAEIVILGAPESLSSTNGQCGTRPAMLNAVQATQEKIAKQEKIRFWSWEKAMGGKCSMKKWIDSGLARKDGVHFTQSGYEQVARLFARDVLKLVKK